MKKKLSTKMNALKFTFGVFLILAWGTTLAAHAAPGDRLGPLRVFPANPRYFTAGGGKPVYLTGSHTWANFQDRWGGGTSAPLNYVQYLDFMIKRRQNFIRLWAWESPRTDSAQESISYCEPLAYPRTGPGLARDGKPKFDLSKFNQAYFDRLRECVIAARERGIYVSVMLFQGWSIRNFKRGRHTFIYHPYHQDNNVNGIRGDANGDGEGEELNTLADPAITRLQEAYVRKVVETVNDLDNVLYEITNESFLPSKPAPYPPSSRDWQLHMIRLIKQCERGKPQQHPVGMTGESASDNAAMLASPADWVSPGVLKWNRRNDPWIADPPAADGRKVIILDTDHLNAPWYKPDAFFSRTWVWKSFTRGHNPILMEWQDMLTDQSPGFEAARRAMSYTRIWAERIDLAHLMPQEALSSTRYCLAHPGVEYLVYQPASGKFTVKLEPGAYQYEWFNPAAGKASGQGTIKTDQKTTAFTPPFDGDAVLYLSRAE